MLTAKTRNPSLVTNSTDCAPSKDLRYCMAAFNGGSAVNATLPEETGDFYPIRDGAIEGCVEYEAVVPPMTCQSFLDRNHITIAQFYKMSVVTPPFQVPLFRLLYTKRRNPQ